MEHVGVERPEQFVDNLIHLDTQKKSCGIDLTVHSVFSLDSPGALDFGGSEFTPAGRSQIISRLRNEDDDYGWWELDGGSYLIQYNERINIDEAMAVIRPLKRLMSTGASHPSVTVSADDEGPLQLVLRVPEIGVSIKENARISRAVVYQ